MQTDTMYFKEHKYLISSLETSLMKISDKILFFFKQPRNENNW